ncbi:hypothetical protein GUY61_29850 [Streptomyces sp. GC420]|nr:hypothetical protein [Streptomyces sp. GC420]
MARLSTTLRSTSIRRRTLLAGVQGEAATALNLPAGRTWTAVILIESGPPEGMFSIVRPLRTQGLRPGA